MAADSSNPNWFPPPRPKPPSAVPLRKILLGTLIPLIALAVGGTLAFRQYQDSTKSSTRSVAAFYSCLQKGGISGVPSGENGLRASEDCLYRLPKTASIADQQSDDPKISFAACISHALEVAKEQASRRAATGFGRGGTSTESTSQAIVQCQTISEGAANGGTGRTGNGGIRGSTTTTILTPTTTLEPVPSTTTGPPVA